MAKRQAYPVTTMPSISLAFFSSLFFQCLSMRANLEQLGAWYAHCCRSIWPFKLINSLLISVSSQDVSSVGLPYLMSSLFFECPSKRNKVQFCSWSIRTFMPQWPPVPRTRDLFCRARHSSHNRLNKRLWRCLAVRITATDLHNVPWSKLNMVQDD